MSMTEEDLNAFKRIGRIVGLTIQEMAHHLEPGITTLELDVIGRAFLDKHGARSAPELVYRFPGATCISVNDEAAHGVPGPRVVQRGDLVNIDVSAELDGYYADSGASFGVPPVAIEAQQLLDATREALQKALGVARAGLPIQMVGRVVENFARDRGYTIIRNLGGHGIGRKLHQEPNFIPHHYDRTEKRRFVEGTVLTLEPFLSTGAIDVTEQSDGWTLKTPNGELSAQFEHTMIITRGKPILLTEVV